MRRVTLLGPELAGLTVDEPAASVRVLLPSFADAALVIPEWTGNQFLLPGGERPIIRTLTPRRVDTGRLELDVDVVMHGTGAASEWAMAARTGDQAAVSGPARGYSIEQVESGRIDIYLAGDETAIPAISQLLERLPPGQRVHAIIEIATPESRVSLPDRPGGLVDWLDALKGTPPGEALVAAVSAAQLGPDSRVWVGGEAAAVQRIRRNLFETRGLARGQATVRGYWKYGRASSAGDDD
jgi:NADPH-dependent ferric siderophore reductase